MAAVCIPFAADNQKTEIIAVRISVNFDCITFVNVIVLMKQLVMKHKGESIRKDIFDLEEFGIYPMVTKAVINALELQ